MRRFESARRLLMRRFFLWASRQRWLGEQMTSRGFARRAVLRFMPGEDVGSAIDAARDLKPKKLSTVLTQLGENISQVSEAQGVFQHYLDVYNRIGPTGLDAQISVKLTQLGLDVSQTETLKFVKALAKRAAELKNFLWIDMEDSSYADRTLELYSQVRREYPNVGVCLQAYLRRTARDLDALIPLQPSIRLVKGAYSEPSHVAFS